MRTITFLLLLIGSITLCAQSQNENDFLNISLLSNVNDYERELYNDVWGYTDAEGREYAIIGSRRATMIYDLSDPLGPQQVARIIGASSIWRDMKSFGNYIYVVADQGDDGLIIVNMENAPDTITWKKWQPFLETNGVQRQLRTCHNIYIDENGYAYLSGCSGQANGGVLIVDVATDPENPTFVSAATNRYSHDNFVRGDTVYSADVYDGVFSITDVSNKTQPKLLANQPTGFNFTHNVWLSDDGKTLFTTDEKGNAYVEAYDISDLSDIKFLDRYRPLDTEGRGVIPHNVHVRDGYLVISYYTDGLKIVDAHQPDNLIEVGSYDTWSGADGGFEGCWGAFPFFKSGIVLASDISTGLYVFDVNYQRACYLEGTVTDASSQIALSGVELKLISGQANSSITDFNGAYKTGLATAGTYQVVISKTGYLTDTVSVELFNGQTTILDHSLRKNVRYQLGGTVISSLENIGIPGAQLLLEGQQLDYTAVANEQGIFTLPDVLADTYTLYIGAWGYQQKVMDLDLLSAAPQPINIALDTGYEDDFVLDLGWQTSGDATTGLWERAIPQGTLIGTTPSNPGEDLSDDLGDYCYVTGNNGTDAATDDVDNGSVRLQSPLMDLSSYQNPAIQYHLWFANNGGTPPLNDTLEVWLYNGQDSALVERLDNSAASGWLPQSQITVSDYLTVTNTMFIRFETSDLPNSGHLVEAAVDGFAVIDQMATSTNEPAAIALQWAASPNPSTTAFELRFTGDIRELKGQLQLYNSAGQLLEVFSAPQTPLTIGQNYQPGMYLLRWIAEGREMGSMKLVKL